MFMQRIVYVEKVSTFSGGSLKARFLFDRSCILIAITEIDFEFASIQL